MEENTGQTTLYLQQGFVHKLKRKLVINKEFIEYETSDQPDSDIVRINWKDFKDIRLGIQLIRGYSFAIGRKHKVLIRDHQKNEIKVNLVSLYGIKRKENQQDFNTLVDLFYTSFLHSHVLGLMDRITRNEKVQFEKITVDNTGIDFKYNKYSVSVSWEDVTVREYRGYFFLQNGKMPEQAIKISYLDDWNGIVIFSLIKTSLQMLTTPKVPSA
jgi:hypothetical protein